MFLISYVICLAAKIFSCFLLESKTFLFFCRSLDTLEKQTSHLFFTFMFFVQVDNNYPISIIIAYVHKNAWQGLYLISISKVTNENLEWVMVFDTPQFSRWYRLQEWHSKWRHGLTFNFSYATLSATFWSLTWINGHQFFGAAVC